MSLIFKNRSYKKEILDDFELQGNDLSENLRELETVNRHLGGYAIVKEGIEFLLQKEKLKQPLQIVDVGCGGGDVLRELALWGRSKNLTLQLMGVDANKNAVEYCKEHSADLPEIRYRQINILSDDFKALEADIVMFNLFLHHFEDDQIISFLKICRQKGGAILINDLQRSAVAYGLFSVMSRLLGFSYISRHDGLLSIRKSFTRSDWKRLIEEAGFENHTIRWRWAFRYQLIAW